MQINQLNQNLQRLMGQLNREMPGYGGNSVVSDKIALNVPLAHSTSTAHLDKIIDSGMLLSPRKLMQSRGLPPDPEHPTVEETLGTDEFVFLFAGPFRYRSSGCGFLFGPDLEKEGEDRGEASPFDSGGLIKHYTGFSEPPKDYLDRYRLPLWQHREYLAGKLRVFFPESELYIQPNIGLTGIHDSITGLQGGDYRQWTHEVRLRDEVAISSKLSAFFYPKISMGITGLEDFLIESQDRGVYIESFETPRDQEFDVMLNSCCDYIKKTLGI